MRTLFEKGFPVSLRFLLLLWVLIFISGTQNSSASMNKSTSCSYQICLIDGNGNPIVNHKYSIWDLNNNVIVKGVTDRNGCTTVTLNDGQQYWFCDDSTPCLHNCILFTVNCMTPGITLTGC